LPIILTPSSSIVVCYASGRINIREITSDDSPVTKYATKLLVSRVIQSAAFSELVAALPIPLIPN